MRNTTIQKTEVTNHLSLLSDLQISGKFGKFSTEVEYRQLLKITVRLVYAGTFLYNNSNSDF
jgi:hypothetical protein